MRRNKAAIAQKACGAEQEQTRQGWQVASGFNKLLPLHTPPGIRHGTGRPPCRPQR